MHHPVYTELAECQDCYKCVRACPVKSIRIVNGHAEVMDDDCTACGLCVTLCPSGAKRGRSEFPEVKKLLIAGEQKIVVSLAPSFVAAFPGVSFSQLSLALKKLGFAAVSETALGAESVSSAVASLLQTRKGLFLSTACPAAVRFVLRYRPDLKDALTPLPSPLLSHAEQLHAALGDDWKVVFLGPCLAKQLESRSQPSKVAFALSFADIKQAFAEEGIDPAHFSPDSQEKDALREVGRGVLYPIDGGMIRGVEPFCQDKQIKFMTVSGLHSIETVLTGLKSERLPERLFLELLACAGGCVNGPKLDEKSNSLLHALAVETRKEATVSPIGNVTASIMDPETIIGKVSSEKKAALNPQEIAHAMARIGKLTLEDELNCGGCGYDNCRHLAEALVQGKAEPAMCVSYMRKLAQNKASALVRSLPLGVVIVDDSLRVLECNLRFAELCGPDVVDIFRASGLGGASVEKLLPIHSLLAAVRDSGHEIVGREIPLAGRVLRVTLFPIEPRRVVGAVLADITEPAMEREAVLSRTQSVIDKQIQTVQQIAHLLGENAAETETMLRSITGAFGAPSRE